MDVVNEVESIVSELLDILVERRSVSLYWSEPGSYFAVWGLDGRTRAYFNLLNSLDESRRPAIESLAAELGLKCKKVRGTDGFESLQLDLPSDRKRAAEVLQRVLSEIFNIQNRLEVRLVRGSDV